MITLKTLRWKNFLSFGNTFTEIDLSSHLTTLVRGRNGSGKSTIGLDAIMYVLYGRPYRNITKPQLINSINKSDMLIELEFNIGSTEYFIRRGMKPNIFDIFKDGQLIEQDAAMRDYQAFLETQILKINEKTFKQIAVLGSASYVPFMQLAAHQRRELVDSILDIEVFSKMSLVLRDRISSTKEELKSVEHKIDLRKTEAVAQQKLIKVMKNNTKSRVNEYENQRVQYLLELARVGSVVNSLTEKCNFLESNEPKFDSSQYELLSEQIGNLRRSNDSHNKKLKSIHSIDECPTCMQSVSDRHVGAVGKSLNKKIADNESKLETLNKELELLKIANDELCNHQSVYQKHAKSLIETNREQINIQKSISDIDASINNLLSNDDDITVEEEKLKIIGANAIKLIERKNYLSEEKHLQDVASQLLKDTGIKTAVVKEYLPVLNSLINKYLAMFDFFVDFTLDESFNEVIKSRGRDVFSYSSFSEGEKRRIDFSILMAFRQLASLKNSAKTNLLVIDELLDGALDLSARESFNELLGSIPDSNIFVISHADASSDHYERVLQVEKNGDFSTYFEVE